MKRKIVSGIMLTLLLVGMLTLAFDIQPVMIVRATPWDGVVDDPTPAQAIWMDPQNATCFGGYTFVVDVLVNITSLTQPGGGTGLYGIQYRLKWDWGVLEAVEIQTHADNVPSGDLLPGWTDVYIAANATTETSHYYAVAATSGVPFTGVASLCTYKFRYAAQVGLIDIYDDFLCDDTGTPIIHITADGIVSPAVPSPDVNGDGIVNIVDIVTAARAFGSTIWELNIVGNLYDPRADLNQDKAVDIIDLVMVAIHFGETYP